ncbi:MAG TPA: hypothetical protein VM891_12730 [Amaricoccus sp.]|nr:hypothetical protein [Amaricoccus sp.]
MRLVLGAIMIAAALWRAGVDWQATIGQGYAYRFGTLGGLLQNHWPEGYTSLAVSLKQSGVPWAWDPIGAIVMSVPVALVLAALGAALIVTRERRARAR